MARKKKDTQMETHDVQTNGHASATALAEPPVNEVRPEPELQAPPPVNGSGGKPQPLVSYRLNSDRTTSVSLAVWANTYTNGKGEEYEQLTMSVQRSYLDQNEQWQTQTKPSWRVHDIPVLLFLLQKAHTFALNRRTSDSSIHF